MKAGDTYEQRTKEKYRRNIGGEDFHYSWDDGWGACVSVSRMSAQEARKLERLSSGFCGYDWMITSIIKDGYIHTKEET